MDLPQPGEVRPRLEVYVGTRRGPPSGGRVGGNGAGHAGRGAGRRSVRGLGLRPDRGEGEPGVVEAEPRAQRDAIDADLALRSDHLRGHDPRRDATLEDLDRPEVALHQAVKLRLEPAPRV